MTPEQREKVVDALGLGATLPEAAGASRVPLRVVREFFEQGKLDRDRGKDTDAATFHEDAWRARALWRMSVRTDALAAAQAGRRVSGDLTRLLERDGLRSRGRSSRPLLLRADDGGGAGLLRSTDAGGPAVQGRGRPVP